MVLIGDADNDDDENDDDDKYDGQARMLDEWNRKFSSISNILSEYLRREGKDEKKRRMRAIFQ